MSEETSRVGWLVGAGIALVVVLAVGCGTWTWWVPGLVAPENWPTWGLRATEPTWTLDAFEPHVLQGRSVLVIRDTYEWTDGGEDPSDVYVYRVSLVDRRTGEVLGRWHSYARFSVRSVRSERVWIERAGAEWPEALSVPSLEPEADLGEILAALGTLEHPVEEVDFPEESTGVRLTLSDGFQWELHPDLRTLDRLHHDTPIPRTPPFGSPSLSCPTQVTLETGRTAVLGTASRRPSLRIVDRRNDVEASEIETPHQGFLDGVFLCGSRDAPVTRAPESVLILHHEQVDDRTRLLVTYVRAAGGMAWSQAVDEWLGTPFDAADETSLVWAEDQGDVVVVWLDGGAASARPGHHALLAFDPESGAVQWISRL